MNKLEIIILCLSIAVVLTAIAIYFILKFFSRLSRRSKQMNDLSSRMRIERSSKADTIISRIKTISEENPQHVEKFKKLEQHYTKLDSAIKDMKKSFLQLVNNKKTAKTKEWNSIIQFVEQKITYADLIEKQFTNISDEITQQEDFLSAEYTFYSKNLRSAIEVYNQKRLTLGKISEQINKLSDQIKGKSQEFSKLIKGAHTEEASVALRQYSSLVTKFVHTISEAPEIQTYLYSTIPYIVKNLVDEYKVKKNEIKAPLDHLNFSNSLHKIAKRYQNAKSQFKNLDFKKTQENIKAILKSVRTIQNMINYEIVSRNFFIENYKTIIQQAKYSLQQYVSIKKQIKQIVSKGYKISIDLTDHIKKLDNLSKDIDQKAMSYVELVSNKEVAYSSKVARSKTLTASLIEFIDNMNEAIQSIWTYNVENSIMKNKLRKCESAINEILSNLKSQNVKLSSDEKEEYSHISNKMNKVSKIIENEIVNKDAMSEANDLVRKTSDFYNVINGKIQIAEIVTNLVQELAPRRALDPKLNVVLNSSEKAFIEGNYDQSLNMIIEGLEEDK